ncbi:hypothetical protein [Corallococcus macrosporus]|uniref:Uncharacterized protein n=1 Tax=Corallococcus macrosporus DSM 14697 TaxID=1189310 RepID=A0A250JQB2_9BACT|nr:hypothetical protein [Corallococcus macrosporus]ATB45306.1 hypothetical protein MYMAC_000891 [Corallococcus macrosporus DSM 14697]
MDRSAGFNLAVPHAALMKGGASDRLVFETRAWAHLTSYLGQLESLPSPFVTGAAEWQRALEAVRAEARRFGSPAQARQWGRARPDALMDETPPPTFYGGLTWWLARVQAAATTVTALQGPLSQGRSADEARQVLRQLGSLAERTRGQMVPLLDAVKAAKPAMLDAHRELERACGDAALALQRLQEQCGGLQARVEELARQSAKLGVFRGNKKQQLLHESQQAQAELTTRQAEAERLREQLGAIEAILREGAWLKAAMDDLTEFLETSRAAWSRFGSGLQQLAVDAAQDQLTDKAWMAKALELPDAAAQWESLGRAARAFSLTALSDDASQHLTRMEDAR